MPFTRGSRKPANSGRKKGAVGKLSLQVLSRLEELGFDPIMQMVEIANDKGAPLELRGKMAAELAQYVWPKRKAIEHSGPGGAPIEMNVSARELLARRIAGLIERRGADGSAQRPN